MKSSEIGDHYVYDHICTDDHGGYCLECDLLTQIIFY